VKRVTRAVQPEDLRPLFGVRMRYYTERAGEGGVIEVIPESAEFLPSPV
jgi:hypothetical protein